MAEDTENSVNQGGNAESSVEASKQSRRKFVRNAAGGSAVVLTLGNRAAWGTYSSGGYSGGKNKKCISKHLLTSYRYANPSMTGKHKSEAETFELAYNSGKYKDKVIDTGNEYCLKPKRRR